MKPLIALFVACLLFSFPGALRAADAPAKPNIVLIYIDDMGYGDIGPFGSTKNRTPNLDRMAKEGMKLTSFYCAPVCSVSRAQVMTGCYGVRVSIPGVFGPQSQYGINAEEHTVAEMLKKQGYTTMIVGKWHLGDQPPFLPIHHGFDHYFGLPYSNDMLRTSTERKAAVVPLMRDDKVIQLLTGEEEDQIVARYTEEAVQFIRKSADSPFFLYLPHTAVHVPIHPGKAFAGKSSNGRYGDWVEEMDWSVGQVLDTLRELKLDKNTLVMFSSDNGPWLSKHADAGEAGPLRGGKGSTFEGGMREATLAWWPGKIAPGSACDAVAGNIDFLPTFVDVSGGTVLTDRKIDGKSMVPLLMGQAKGSQREAHYYFRGLKLEAVRQGPWKLALGPQVEANGSGKDDPDAKATGVRLYDLDAEIGERTNLAAQHPDVVEKLQALAKTMNAALGDGKAEVRPAGHVDKPTMLYASPDAPKTKATKSAKSGALITRPVALDTLKPGAILTPEAAPHIANRPFSLSCDITPLAPDGVILAHGGASIGYALYLEHGHLVFAVRKGNELATVQSPDTVGKTASVQARLAADGGITLLVNGHSVATGKGLGLIAREPVENFCIGLDDGHPVGEYPPKSPFKGSIEHVKLEAAEAK